MIKTGSLLTGLLIFAFSSVSFAAERAKVNIMCKVFLANKFKSDIVMSLKY